MHLSKTSNDQTPTDTPPNSFATRPLTPPPSDEKPTSRVTEVLRLLRGLRDGTPVTCEPWQVISFSVSNYEEVHRRLVADESLWGYVNNKVRYDYDSHRQKLVVRMPTPLHDTFIGKVVVDIMFQLRILGAGSNAAAQFARSVEPAGSSRIVFRAAPDRESGAPAGIARTRIQHEPDASFAYEHAKYPGVVIEVSYSQKRKDLSRLADDYILESNGNIRVVVGLDIEYRGSKKATLSVWRPQVVVSERDGHEEMIAAQLVADQEFRREDGTPVTSAALQLQLKDFASELVGESYALADEVISLSSDTLCRHLMAAEARLQAEERGLEDLPRPGLRKRRRSSTPPEQMASDDEAIFRTQEENVAKRVARDDSSYKASSQSSGDSG
ncbi:hypothetical protein B0A49_13400 [Cryomyces minteri]|uniref:Uncharacterized protein n=1 Tax=Cryomyces minteri TaxID=331657 RepID=A0A4V5NC08_9PEZI|nr:hypothetical protein B0A49_13400 [Cryomyces minteri]